MSSTSLEEQIRSALPAARAGGAGHVCARLAAALGAKESDILQAAGAMLGVECASDEQLSRAGPCEINGSPLAGVLVLTEADRTTVVLSDPWDERIRTAVRRRYGPQTRFAIAAHSAIEEARTAGQTPVALPAEAGGDSAPVHGSSEVTSGHPVDPSRLVTEKNPVLRFVDRVVLEAWTAGASDIHLETSRDGLHCRYRLDGSLTSGPVLKGADAARQAVSRVKVLAELDIAEQRVPQDGRVRFVLDGRPIDFRVSIMPSAHGEDAVLRILDKRQLASFQDRLTLDVLGFDAEHQAALRELADRAHGMLLVTGPTGSGKTTTLYSLLTELASGEEKTITIEDPIEYEVEGVLQIPVNEKKGLTFARGLRSVLRHDPDRIMVGEIRDRETADIAVQAALTGHQVFATVHANNVFDVIGRFVHMQVDLYSLMSSLNGVVSQRLVRKLCPHCRAPQPTTDTQRRRLMTLGLSPPEELHTATGCDACRGVGYRGRTAIVELVALDDAFRDLAVRRASLAEAKQYLDQRGVQTLAQSGLKLLTDGVTSFAEYWRAVATG